MSAVKQISATARTNVGKGAARAVRREGRIPAVIYGAGKAPTPVTLDKSETNFLIYAGHFLTTVFEIEVDGERRGSFPATISSTPSRTRSSTSISCVSRPARAFASRFPSTRSMPLCLRA